MSSGRRKLWFGPAVFSTLAVASLGTAVVLIGKTDVYAAAGAAFAGDLYLLWAASHDEKERGSPGRSFPPLLLVVFGPAILSVVLALAGALGPPTEAAERAVLLAGFSVSLLLSTFPLPLAIRAKMREARVERGAARPSVSVLVPAFNEQPVIARTMDSLQEEGLKEKEVIVVDDGSTDLTKAVAHQYASHRVKLVRQKNSGKASALNHGLLYAKGDVVVTIDADSMVATDSIGEIVGPMEDPRVVAVAGNVKVLNAGSLLTRVQELEYMMAINTIRRAYSVFGTVMVIPGAFGAFRRSAVAEVGGYDTDTVTEDFDLTVKLLKKNGRVAASPSGTAYTEVPRTVKGLYRQRMRWGTGTFQTVYKHREVIMDRGFGRLHSVGFPLMLLSLLNPFVSFIGIGAGVALTLAGEGMLFLEMLGFFLLAQAFVSLIAISIDEGDYGLVKYSPLFVVGYKQFMDFVMVASAFNALLGRGKSWNKVQREGGTEAMKVTGVSPV